MSQARLLQVAIPRVPQRSSTRGRAFSVVAPRLWNQLLEELCQAPSLYSFRRQLKTVLYSRGLQPQVCGPVSVRGLHRTGPRRQISPPARWVWCAHVHVRESGGVRRWAWHACADGHGTMLTRARKRAVPHSSVNMLHPPANVLHIPVSVVGAPTHPRTPPPK